MTDDGWSFGHAALVFLRAVYNDLIGDARLRHRLLGRAYIQQKMFGGDGRVATCLGGAKNPNLTPVIFLHGTPGSGHDWVWFLKHAADKYNILAVDRPGFGPVMAEAPNLQADMAVLSDIVNFMAAKGKKPVIAGHSLGGGLAARLAAEHPDQCAGLVLIGASLDPALERIFPVQRWFARWPLSRLLTRSVRYSNIELLQYPDFLSDLQPRLKNITCPVAVLHSRDDRLTPYKNADYVQRHCTKAASVNIMGFDTGGHFLNRTRPKDILQALAALS